MNKMNKKAMTVFEMIIALMLMAVVTILCINVLKKNVARNNDIIKFRHVYGAVAEAVFQLKNDPIMYNNDGFADTKEGSYMNDSKKYSGVTKFKRLFKSKFNIYKDNIEINFKYEIPQYTYTGTPENITVYTDKISCFMDNKGITYCPPDTSANNLVDMYIPVYVSKIDTAKENTIGEERIIIIKVSKIGKIDLPPLIKKSDSTILIDCYNGKFRECNSKKENSYDDCIEQGLIDYNTYYHCQAIDKMNDMDF